MLFASMPRRSGCANGCETSKQKHRSPIANRISVTIGFLKWSCRRDWNVPERLASQCMSARVATESAEARFGSHAPLTRHIIRRAWVFGGLLSGPPDRSFAEEAKLNWLLRQLLGFLS